MEENKTIDYYSVVSYLSNSLPYHWTLRPLTADLSWTYVCCMLWSVKFYNERGWRKQRSTQRSSLSQLQLLQLTFTLSSVGQQEFVRLQRATVKPGNKSQ